MYQPLAQRLELETAERHFAGRPWRRVNLEINFNAERSFDICYTLFFAQSFAQKLEWLFSASFVNQDGLHSSEEAGGSP